MRFMVAASKPSASAMRSAAAAICSRVRRGWRPGGWGRAQISAFSTADSVVVDVRTVYE